ncbi:MAG TPA: hypothetical protein VHR45_07100 [Thermoanaerobaculia bacterium]|nr:hypothetical protein [Thermoanaerobaculia bacterium]
MPGWYHDAIPNKEEDLQNRWKWLLLAVIVMLAVETAVLFRYSIVGVAQPEGPWLGLRLDRWTGKISTITKFQGIQEIPGQ